MRHILVSILLLTVFAVSAHGENHQEKDALQQLGQKAVLVIKKNRTESLNGYLLIVCKASGWKALSKDSDLGPFLKYKKAASNLDAVVAMPENTKDGSTYGVYFEDGKPTGLVEIKTGKGETITDANVAKGYAPVAEDSASGATDQIRFEAVEVFTDDNTPIPTLKVVSEGQGGPANQRGDFRSGAIKSATGYVLVWNQPNNYYVLEINGKDVRQTSTERKFFSVDGMFLQIVDAAIEDVVQAAQRQKMNDREILEAHRDWEAKFMEGEYKAKLKVEYSWQKLNNGKDALLWHASLPETAKGNVKKQVYLSVVHGDYVLMLGGAVTDTSGERVTQLLLLNTMQTLKTSNQPTDLQKVRDAIRKETPGN